MNKEILGRELEAKQERQELGDALFDDMHVLETLINYIDTLAPVQKLDNTEARIAYYQVDKSLGAYHILLQGILKRLDEAVCLLGEDENEED